MTQLGSLQDNDRNSFKTVVDNGLQEVARRVDDPITQAKLDDVISALSGATNTTATVYNVTATLANTEYSQVLPANTKSFVLQARGSAKIKLAYTSGINSGDYLTVPIGTTFNDNNYYSAQTIYFTSSLAGEVIEIVAYV